MLPTISIFLLLQLLVQAGQALPRSVERNVRIENLSSLRTMIPAASDHGDKYFYESTFHQHYDGRFAEHSLSETEQHDHLVLLVTSYLSTMYDIGAETWIMHGSLLGWWWNRKIMPWDSDIDVQVTEDTMDYLAGYYNMTAHRFDFPNRRSKRYLLDVNPHYINNSTSDWMNVIDARWIDTETGLFIDITVLRKDRQVNDQNSEGMMYCKDKHRFREADVFPLRESVFEGVPVRIPFSYTRLLEGEYGPGSLTETRFNNYYFDQNQLEWAKV